MKPNGRGTRGAEEDNPPAHDEDAEPMTLSTHVLDATTGRPAAGVQVRLEHGADVGWAPAWPGPDGRRRAAPAVRPRGCRRLRARRVPHHVRHRRVLHGSRRAVVLPRGHDHLRDDRAGRALPRAAAAQPLYSIPRPLWCSRGAWDAQRPDRPQPSPLCFPWGLVFLSATGSLPSATCPKIFLTFCLTSSSCTFAATLPIV